MDEYWETDEAKDKSSKASNAQNSDRGGLGAHIHVAGLDSFLHIQRKMEKEAGRPVSIGEVYMKTHTKKDGTYVDGKAKQIGESYTQNLQARLSQIEVDPLMTSDGTTQPLELRPDEMNKIFIDTTIEDGRGKFYGLGRLSRIYGKGSEQTSWGSSSSTIATLEEKLEAVKRKIEEQAAENKRRDDELPR